MLNYPYICIFHVLFLLNNDNFIVIFLDNLILSFYITLNEHWRMLVRSSISLCGENAGRVWHVVNEKLSVDEQTLKLTAMLGEEEFYTAIGWLARENKIKKTNNFYSLDASNLSKDIGTNAGKIWKILDIWEEADIQTLQQLADTSHEEIYTGLGWLAREGKIDKNDQNRYYLK